MIKLSSENIKGTLLEASSVIRDQLSKIASLEEKVASYQKKERCEKIARDMNRKNINPDMSLEEKVAELVTKEAAELDKIEAATELVTPGMNNFELDRTEKTASTVDAKLKLFQELQLL